MILLITKIMILLIIKLLLGMHITYILFYAHQIVLDHKYTNFIINFKCKVVKCHNYDKYAFYLEK